MDTESINCIQYDCEIGYRNMIQIGWRTTCPVNHEAKVIRLTGTVRRSISTDKVTVKVVEESTKKCRKSKGLLLTVGFV